jgi:protein-S-isoprenylcysteine O-methyltransferase Ste14
MAGIRVDWPRAITPALFALGLAVNIAGLAANLGRHSWSLRPEAIAFIAVNILWLLWEAPVSLGRPSTKPKEVSTLIAYGCTRFATVAAAELGPVRGHLAAGWVAAAAVLFTGGIALRLVAIRTLGRFYSHHVIRRDDHAIVRTGPYSLIRHPAYAGMLLAHIGLVMFFLSWWSVTLLVMLAAVLAWRIRVEERALLVLPAYRDYAAEHSRLVPGVW